MEAYMKAEEEDWHKKHPVSHAKEDGPCMESDRPPTKQQPPQQQHQEQTHRSPSRILHNCASSLLSTARKTYSRLEQAGAPAGPLARRLSAAVTPYLHPAVHRCLATLARADDGIYKAMLAASPSAAAKLERLDFQVAGLCTVLPDKFDDAVGRVSEKVQRVPLVGSMMRACGCLMSVLTDWPSSDERVIGVDVSRGGDERTEAGRPRWDEMIDGMREKDFRVEGEEDGKGMKGGGGEVEDADDDAVSIGQESMVTADGGEGLCPWDEPGTILELLDEGWHSAPPRRKSSLVL